MPGIPNLIERTYTLRFYRAPGSMPDLVNEMSLETAILALDVGVLGALHEKPANPCEIAGQLVAGDIGLEAMLSFLELAEYVSERRGMFSLTRMTEMWLLESAGSGYVRTIGSGRRFCIRIANEHATDSNWNDKPSVSIYEGLDDHPVRRPIAQMAFELTAERLGD